MMNYNEFKNEAIANFLSYMPGEYQNMILQTITCKKINRILDGINLITVENGTNMSPIIYINDMYMDYVRTGDFETVMESYARVMANAFSNLPSVPNIDKETVKNRVIFQLVNTVQNEALLKEVPHRSFQDLSVIYRYAIQLDQNGIMSAVIHNRLAETLGFSEPELYRLAVLNTRQLTALDVRSMPEFLREISDPTDSDEESEDFLKDIPENDMYVITNSYKVHGAALIMYNDVLDSLAERLEDDLYILPSSIHETIAIAVSDRDANELAEMVLEINMAQVDLSERLSNQVYYYDRETRTLSRATDTPNKWLDQLVA